MDQHFYFAPYVGSVGVVLILVRLMVKARNLRGIACGAVTETEALLTGLSLEEIRSKSFVKIMAARRAPQP